MPLLSHREKQDNDLKTYCDNKKIPYTMFDSWLVVRDMLKDIIEGRLDANTLRKKSEPL